MVTDVPTTFPLSKVSVVPATAIGFCNVEGTVGGDADADWIWDADGEFDEAVDDEVPLEF